MEDDDCWPHTWQEVSTEDDAAGLRPDEGERRIKAAGLLNDQR
jgi:hypothetical protein